MPQVPPSELVDLDFYSRQVAQNFKDKGDAFLHFARHGQALGLNPSPYFYTRWYMWQHPDAVGFFSALDHFVETAPKCLINPAPFIDGPKLLSLHPGCKNMVELLYSMVKGEDCAISPVIEEHLMNLDLQRRKINAGIRPKLAVRKPRRGENLVWVQCGSKFSFDSFHVPENGRSWDLLCNWYNFDRVDLRKGEIHILQRGTKTTAINQVFRHFPDIFENYGYVLFLDDDVAIDVNQLDKLFRIAKKEGLELFQPALAKGSQSVWSSLFKKGGSQMREVGGVEIMMPCFRSDALFRCRDIFADNISGYGVDFLFSERIRENGGKCHVLDTVEAAHYEPVKSGSGTYYRFMRQLGILPQLELYGAILEKGKFPDFGEVEE